MYPTSRRLCITSRTNSSLSTYESSYSVLPGNDTRLTADLCDSDGYPSSSSIAEDLDEPLVKGWAKPLLFATALCPFEGPGADEGPASRWESSETDSAESLSLSASLMVAVSAGARVAENGESVGIRACSAGVRGTEAEGAGWASKRSRLRTRKTSGSALDEWGAGWAGRGLPAEGWR